VNEPAEPTESAAPAESIGADEEIRPVRRFRHVRALFAPAARVLGKLPHPPWRSKRGILLLFILFAGFGAVGTMGGVAAIGYSETPAFCSKCHTMDPELKAYAQSAHKEVTCAECHISPGLAGFVKAKANGTKQLLHILTGEYPTPIRPPDHADLPPVRDTCLKCHSLKEITENGGPVKLVLRPRYRPDEANTRENIAILLRPAGLGQASGTTGITGAPGTAADEGVAGVHWHVQEKVTYTSSDIRAQKIDLVEMTAKDGTVRQFIAGSEVAVSEDVKPDIARLKLSQKSRLMDCTDCHNRVGHAVPSPDRAIDEALASGRISTNLPFIKRDSVALLSGDYPTLAAADKAFTGLRASIATRYPLVFKTQGAKVTQAIDELKLQYRLVATPEMKVQAKTYPDNLGHQTSQGCFRCHDGAHYLVSKGKITATKIPSSCATCHTFPQIGASATSFPLGARPADHKDKLYVFSHKIAVSSKTVAGTSCAACHVKSYCVSCHKSGVLKVKHTAMLFNHAKEITALGGTTSCATCHQRVSCAQCHKDPVLEPRGLPSGALPAGSIPLAIKPQPAS